MIRTRSILFVTLVVCMVPSLASAATFVGRPATVPTPAPKTLAQSRTVASVVGPRLVRALGNSPKYAGITWGIVSVDCQRIGATVKYTCKAILAYYYDGSPGLVYQNGIGVDAWIRSSGHVSWATVGAFWKVCDPTTPGCHWPGPS
jgi:hypothetical protein